MENFCPYPLDCNGVPVAISDHVSCHDNRGFSIAEKMSQ